MDLSVENKSRKMEMRSLRKQIEDLEKEKASLVKENEMHLLFKCTYKT